MRLALVAVLAACGTNSVSLPLVAPGQPKLLAYAIGYGAWHTLDGVYDGDTTTYQLDLDGDFSLAYVCLDPDGAFHAAEVRARRVRRQRSALRDPQRF